ncbi:MAG: DUF1565 domain-containing protein [Oscillatoriales cyanobacterium SM2_1_8]|nr:DUF1565 domain-containing protein [Oscillatoriales cyanobacterium SM2_1_8]
MAALTPVARWLGVPVAIACSVPLFLLPARANTGGTTTVPSAAPAADPIVGPMLQIAPTGNDAQGNGTAAAPFRSVTAALATQPAPGTVLQLAAGTYTAETGEQFPLRIPAGVKLVGNPETQGQGVVVAGGGTFISPTFARQNITILLGSGAALSGLTVTNANPRGYGLWVESGKDVEIYRNAFVGSAHDGVFLTGETSALVRDNLFRGNKANGLSAVGSSQGEILGNTFENTGYGLAIGQRSMVRVANNQIVKNRSGIVISNLAQPVLRNNLIADHAEDGVVILRDRRGEPKPDLGTATDPGKNVFRNNQRRDLDNASGVAQTAIGNELDARKVAGTFDPPMPKPPAPAPARPTAPASRPAPRR